MESPTIFHLWCNRKLFPIIQRSQDQRSPSRIHIRHWWHTLSPLSITATLDIMGIYEIMCAEGRVCVFLKVFYSTRCGWLARHALEETCDCLCQLSWLLCDTEELCGKLLTNISCSQTTCIFIRKKNKKTKKTITT